jgi:hypothetical protein
MHYRFTLRDGYLQAELVGRESVEETVSFIRALAAEALKTRCTRVLLSVRRSRSIFTVEKYQISSYLHQLAAVPEARVALVGDSSEMHAAHQYIEVLARQQNAGVRAFRDEARAREWLSIPGEAVEKPPAARGPGLRSD